jgi:uncharacterized membrane protein YheB (UPF0754 family)
MKKLVDEHFNNNETVIPMSIISDNNGFAPDEIRHIYSVVDEDLKNEIPKSLSDNQIHFNNNYLKYHFDPSTVRDVTNISDNLKEMIVNTLPYYIMEHYHSTNINYYLKHMLESEIYSPTVVTFYFANKSEIDSKIKENFDLNIEV